MSMMQQLDRLRQSMITQVVGGPQPVTWTDLVGVTVEPDNTLKKTATTAWGNGGAASVEILSGDGEVFSTATNLNTYRMFGFSPTNANANYNSIRHACYFVSNATGLALEAWENGARRKVYGPYSIGAVGSVERVGTTIYYKHNGVVFHTSALSSSGPLLVDVAIYNQNATLSNVLLEDNS